MAKHGKNYRNAAEKVDALKQYTPDDGVKLMKEIAFTKFDSSVELHIRTGLDPKHADQQVRGSAVLPSGTGRTQRVVAFAQGDKAREAEAAGAAASPRDSTLPAAISGGAANAFFTWIAK